MQYSHYSQLHQDYVYQQIQKNFKWLSYQQILKNVGYKIILLGIIIEAMRDQIIYEQSEKNKKKKVKKMIEVEVDEDEFKVKEVGTQKLVTKQSEQLIQSSIKQKGKQAKK
ncbi:unnamed protein product [Paramecium sonneborni]|uniref:Uncharacterized protein n=1 Tax=Paramecium sonneborni TaxID=65129 RepID=A0A8S1QRH8_9CILI|nr:unnamed protein product [Paramecium sonneborni]